MSLRGLRANGWWLSQCLFWVNMPVVFGVGSVPRCLLPNQGSFCLNLLLKDSAEGGPKRVDLHLSQQATNGEFIMEPPLPLSRPCRNDSCCSLSPCVVSASLLPFPFPPSSAATRLSKLHMPRKLPSLSDGERLVNRILQLGPRGTKFIG